MDLGMTQEEVTSSQSAMKSLSEKCKELLDSVERLLNNLPRAPNRAGIFANKWLESAETLARQLHNVGEEVSPLFDHLVFQPRGNPSIRLPELLRTKLDIEQEKKEKEILENNNFIITNYDILNQKKNQSDEGIKNIVNAVLNHKDVESISAKRRRAATRPPSTLDNFDGTSLLKLLKHNNRKKIKMEEVEDIF